MAKKSSERGLTGMPLTQLQAELRRRQGNVRRMERQRERLMAKVQELDKQIMSLGGHARGTGRKRPKNESNLAEALHKVLKGKTMGVTEVAQAVQEAGYQTTAENFRTIVNQCLIRHRKLFKKQSRGQYTSI